MAYSSCGTFLLCDLQIKDTFWIMQEYSQLSKADDFNANMQEVMTIRFFFLKPFMPLNSGNFLESQRSLSIDISKQMTRVGSLVHEFVYKDMDNDLGPRGNGPSVGIGASWPVTVQ